MSEKVKKHLLEYCQRKGYESDDASLFEMLRDAGILDRKEICQHRWWNEYRYTVEIDGMLVGFVYAEANRDESVMELGYDFDPDSICEMEAVPKTITIYEPIKE